MIVRDAPPLSPAASVAPVATMPQVPQRRSVAPLWIAYLVAVLGTGAVGVGDWFVPAVFTPFALLASAVVVVIAAVLGGLGPGLLATALGTGIGAGFLWYSGAELTWRAAVPVAVFAAFGVLVSLLSAARLRAARRAMIARGELSTVLGDLTEGVLLHDRAGSLVFANDAAARFVGFASGEELRRATARVLIERFEFLDARGQSVPLETFIAVGKGQEGRTAEQVYEVRDRTTGQARWWSAQSTALAPAPTRRGKANALTTATLFRDITQQRQADAALATSERRLRALIAHSVDAFALLDARGGLLFTSPAVSTMLGYREEELRGVNAFSLVHPNDVARATALVAALRGDGAAPSDLFRLRHRDGRWRWIEATGSDLTHDPAVRAALLNLRDITPRKRAEDDLIASERRFHALLARAADAIIVTDAAGAIIYASPATEHLLGYAPDALAGSDRFSDIHPADVPQVRAFFQTLTADVEEASVPTVAVIAYRMRHRDGTDRRVEMTATNLLHDPAVRGVVGNFRDITEAARTAARQQFLREVNERCAAASGDEETVAAVAGVAVPQFAAGCAVEVRSPAGKLRRAFTALPPGAADDSPDLFATTPAAAYVARALITGQSALFAPAPPALPAVERAGQTDAAPPMPASMLVVPLIARGVTLGAVTFIAPADAPFDAVDRDTAGEFAARLALALAQTRLVTDMDIAETRYRLLFDVISDAVLIVDADGAYTDANTAFTDLVGYPLDEVRRSRIGAFAPDAAGAMAAFAAHRSDAEWHEETEVVRQDGTRVPVEVTTTAMHTARGVSYLSIWRVLPVAEASADEHPAKPED